MALTLWPWTHGQYCYSCYHFPPSPEPTNPDGGEVKKGARVTHYVPQLRRPLSPRFTAH